MGLRDWLAKNVAGPSGYGETMAREAVKNGLAVGRTLYLGHGTRTAASSLVVCADENHMKSEGFQPYCLEPLNPPPMEDASKLSKHTRIAGIAFATQCIMTAASNFMKTENADVFNRSMGASAKRELLKLDIGITVEHVLQYLRLLTLGDGIRTVLDVEEPGTGDVLSLLLAEVSKNGSSGAVVFQRRGAIGFDLIVTTLAEETIKSIAGASQKYGW